VTLRPTRVGFLVRPNQKNFLQVRQIIRMCTCLWGGAFNPIIPVCSSLPDAWRNESFREVTGKGLADAYIRFFEPDVFVEAEAGLAKEAGVIESRLGTSSRVISLKKFVGSDDRSQSDFLFGLSVFDAYRDLYQKELKFTSREKRKVGVFTDDHPFCEAVFGSFPNVRQIDYIKKAYLDIFEPESFAASASNCLKMIKSEYFSPLSATFHELDVTFDNRSDPIIFIFEPRAMIIVLTGTELFADFRVEQTWKELGGEHAAAVKHASVNLDDLWTLAEVTQGLYLGLPSYWKWRRRRRQKTKGVALQPAP
jgi:hypothetical protein